MTTPALRGIRTLLLCCAFWLAGSATAQAGMLRVDDATRWPVALDTRAEVFEDTSTRLSLDEIDALESGVTGGFQPGSAARMRPSGCGSRW